MEKFINKKKKQLILWSTLAIILFLVIIVLDLLELKNILIPIVNYPGATSLLAGVFAVGLVNIITIKSALKNPDKMKKLQLSDSDERIIEIKKQTSYMIDFVFLSGLLIATCIFSFINATIFKTLMCVLIIKAVLLALGEIINMKKY